MGFFSKGLKNEFETAVVNEPSVFEPLKFYCIVFDVSMQSYNIPLAGYGQPPNASTGYASQSPYQPYGEPPPAYEEHQTTPSAPPAEKM